MFLRGVCSSVSTGLFPNNLPGRFLARSLAHLCSSQTSWSMTPHRASDEESCRVNRPLPNLISRPVRLTPVESLYIRLNGGDKRWAHSHFIPLGVRLFSVKSVTVFSLPFNNGAWVAVTITITATRRRSAQNFLHPTENLNLYVSMWGKIILHWAQGAMKTEGNEFSGTSHSCIKKERERKCMWTIEILLRWTQWRV